MKKIVSFLTIILLFTNCSVPYDGETRYIFETTVVDSNNNPIPNVQCNATFYNVYSSKNKGPIFSGGSDDGDLIVSSFSDANGTVRLIFPFAIKGNRVRVQIENDRNSFGESWFEFINIQKSDFINFKISEPAITLFEANEIVGLQIEVFNSTSNKYISKMEFIGRKSETVKDFQSTPNELQPLQITTSFYNVAKNHVATLKYEVTTTSANGQESLVVIEEQITILSENITYEISL